MSNVIKSRYVYLNDSEKKIIDSNEKSEKFRLINLSNHAAEYLVSEEYATALEADESGFTEGLMATVVNTVSPEEEEELLKQAVSQVLEEAKEQAEQILKEAEEQAKKLSDTLYEESRIKGYEDGIKQGETEALKKKAEYEVLIEEHSKEYQAQMDALEPEFASIVCTLVEKLTGVIAADKKDIILYLIHKAILNSDNCKSYLIRTSKEDYELVLSKTEDFKSLVSSDTIIDISVDKDLSKNQCQIETEFSIIDCSLDVQLESLIQDIKLLSSQKD